MPDWGPHEFFIHFTRWIITITMVTIKRYYDPTAALIAKAILEGEGLLVFLKNENFASVMPLHDPMIGEIELQVEQEDVERALEILGPDPETHEEVAALSKRLNRVFLVTICCGLLAGGIHAAYHNFNNADLTVSLFVGLLGAIVTFLLMSALYKP